MKTRYIIQNWCSDVLQYTEKFNNSNYGNSLGIPLIFQSKNDAYWYLDMNYTNEEREHLHVIENSTYNEQ